MQRVRLSSEQAPVLKLGDSQMTLSPKFRLAITQTPTSRLSDEPLIPGLPDDVALNCLLRLPVDSHTSCRSVCKKWHSVLGSKERFFTWRGECGLIDPWLFVFACHRCTGKIRWQALDLTHFTWHDVPPMPYREKACPHGFRCTSLPREGALLVCGGVVDAADCPLDSVLRFEMRKNRWYVMDRMISARSCFATGVVDGMVYVAGGNSSDLFELGSAEVMDPSRGGVWSPVARMGAEMAVYDSAVLRGKLLVTEGWVWPFYMSPRGQLYDPKSDTWEGMAVGLREGWTGLSVVVHGRLFVVSELERMRLKVYDEGDDSWDPIEGPPLPEQMCKPFAVSACESRIYVVSRNLHIAVGRILRLDAKGEPGKLKFGVQWRVVEAPERFADLTPSSSEVLFA